MAGEILARTLLRPQILGPAYSTQNLPISFPFTETFFVNPIDIDGDEYELIYEPEENAPVPANAPGAEARILPLGGLEKNRASLFFTYNKIVFPEIVLNAITEPGSMTLQNMARTEIMRQLARFKKRHAIFMELVIAKIITAGVVHIRNADGAIVEAGGNGITSCTMRVDASHQGNIGGLVSALFSVAGTDIAAIIEAIKDAARSANVPEPTDIWINANNLKYLRNNTKFETWAARTEFATRPIVQGGMIEGLWGLNWHFIGGKYTAADGTKKPYVPLDVATLTPPPGDWVQASRGSTVIPTRSGVTMDLEEAVRSALKVYGEFAYGAVNFDPFKVMGYMGNKFGLHFAEPNAVWQATAFPSA